MKASMLSFIPAIVLGSALAHAAPWDKPGWTLTFHDEFDGTSVDATQWKKRYKWGEAQINGELQAYVDDAFVVSGGNLRIVGTHASGTYAGKTFGYRSGVLTSMHEQTYGWFEARVRMPKGKGLWPAFWLYHSTSVPGIDEIDVQEFLGDKVDTVYTTLHQTPDKHDGKAFVGPDFSADFHVFAVDWAKDHVNFYVDGALVHEHAGDAPSVPMYLIVNLAIGGDWPGAPDSTTVFPAYYDVDYVRAYTKDDAPDAGPSGDAATDSVSTADADADADSDAAADSDADADAAAGANADAASDVEGGCGCRTHGEAPTSATALGTLLFASAFALRRRPRR